MAKTNEYHKKAGTVNRRTIVDDWSPLRSYWGWTYRIRCTTAEDEAWSVSYRFMIVTSDGKKAK